MLSVDNKLTAQEQKIGVKPAGASVCSHQQNSTAQFKGSSLDELKDFLVARGERKIEETSDQLIAQLREGKFLSEELISRISKKVAEKTISKILTADIERQGPSVNSVNKLVRTPSRVLGF